MNDDKNFKKIVCQLRYANGGYSLRTIVIVLFKKKYLSKRCGSVKPHFFTLWA